ncbi:G-type lectin receptor kinase [Panicum miliaceum]|uniref:G-type lectin receptor kinase n=1 Tax=Panicum miliaceum TaxID=4540 RepID=A0A3L6PUN5_PANMI|nr:G-type lectin receptor kinase [Panicum miliaceum]
MQFKLIAMSHVDWPLADYEQYATITKDQCQQLCLTDCFCAIAVFHDQSNTCWKKKMPLSNGNMGDNVERTLFVKVRKNNSTQSELVGSNKWKKDKKNWILGSSLFLGSSVLVNVLLISVILFGAYCTITIKEAPSLQSSNNIGLPLKAFTYIELEKATSGFREVLGTGASGIVYKGQLQDDLSTEIAVKKIDKLEHEMEKEFSVEVQTIGQTHHKNLNILLDGNFTAKISDFGLAKLLRTTQTQTNTGIRGTRGYVAPEWFKSIGITAKVDVYSFGVILLELICCRRNVELDAAEDQKILTDWANDCYRCGRVDFLVEGDDEATLNLTKVERFVAVALWCLQEDPTIRPTMLKVTQMLDEAAAVPTPPDPSSFISSLP